MSDLGLSLSLQAIDHQLAAMPCERYLIRLIHHQTRRAFPGARLWTAAQLAEESIVKFLRVRNRDGFDVYLQPYAFPSNAGYILVDLDQAQPTVLDAMCADGHQPCLVIDTSPGRLQAWVQVSAQPLPPAVATAIGRRLANLYQGDRASADWRHLGRLAGFTNQKPQRRLPGGLAPWVKVRQATPGLARNSRSLLQFAWRALTWSVCPSRPVPTVAPSWPRTRTPAAAVPTRSAPTTAPPAVPPAITTPAASAIYQTWLRRLRIPQRFPHPDWSVADLWIAKELLRSSASAAEVKIILQLGSPEFPRSHAAPEDYLQRTLTRAEAEIAASFPARCRPIAFP